MNETMALGGAAAGPAALAVERVSHAYGARKALDDVSFSVRPATFAVLLGLNGAGKSTLFSVITHLYAARAGAVRIFGHDVARQSGAALAELGVVFQSRTLDPDLSVEQNMLYQGALQGIGPRQARARARDLVARMGLADRLKDRVRQLSGGQARRVEIARALLHAPRLVLLDEPTAGLDIKARADILALTRRLVAEDGVGVLWTTHLVDEIRPDDQVVLLHKGRVLADDRAVAVIAAAGADSIGAAFSRLTSGAGEEDA
ncbi:ABC-2 type transport system ATP-binding protein [Roseiarcus fermentans]|uniref:ABC-2 type transport system ATP-binding protein n=1 Tax=Roseiarcus fermentans TaxID=1473586 RepID=A0A366FE28_9HYPH|nr:ABC transporter ATP-binding protein [Roseiarcus fermentans]RBP12924.1 ABC-2 type transport system ATP-binding protein [Roseiarcus fermentans]